MAEFEFGLRQFIMAEYNKYVNDGQDSFTAKANVIKTLIKEAEELASSEQNPTRYQKLYTLISQPTIDILKSHRNRKLKKGQAELASSIELAIHSIYEELSMHRV